MIDFMAQGSKETTMKTVENISFLCKRYFPDLQAIYLFGSFGTVYDTATSDVDLALLLPVSRAKAVGSLAMHDLRFELEAQLQKEVDLINLRKVSTVFQKEIIAADRCIYKADLYATAEFEMLTISFYQKLNEERAGVYNAMSIDVVLNKKESIERCIRQIRSYYAQPSEWEFEKDYFKQDAIAINLQRICEQAIDLANMTVKEKKLGIPTESRQSFRLLVIHNIIEKEMGDNLERMVGFRNTLVHEYQELDISIMIDVITNHLEPLVDYTNYILKQFSS